MDLWRTLAHNKELEKDAVCSDYVTSGLQETLTSIVLLKVTHAYVSMIPERLLIRWPHYQDGFNQSSRAADTARLNAARFLNPIWVLISPGCR